jgi:hypothetical protein
MGRVGCWFGEEIAGGLPGLKRIVFFYV